MLPTRDNGSSCAYLRYRDGPERTLARGAYPVAVSPRGFRILGGAAFPGWPAGTVSR
jgi:hypothetical protein